MSPKAVQYRANSIIYFKGDQSDRIFLLNSGKVSLSYVDIETGQEVRDLIKMGEFFGVKSALGRYMREETAIVLQDSAVMVFSVPEFEQVASKNLRIITKMLTVFSNQLRRIHRQVQNLMVSDEQVNPETGLYKIGEYYLKNKRFGQALYAFKTVPRVLSHRRVRNRRHHQDRAGGGVSLEVRFGCRRPASSAGPSPRSAPAAAPRARGGPGRVPRPRRAGESVGARPAVLQRRQPGEPGEVHGGVQGVQEDPGRRGRIPSTPPRRSSRWRSASST